jgi:hypothetical protein
MAQNSLNQIVLDAVKQANGNTQTGLGPQGIVQSLLPQSSDSFSSALTEAARQIAGLTASNQALVDVVNGNTQAVLQNSAAHSSGGGNVASTVGSVASAVFGSGLGLVPLVSSLVNLFGGGNSEPPPTLLRYAAPAALNVNLADTAGASSGISSFPGVVYGQNGLPQPVPQSQTQAPAQIAASSPAAPQISIQVNALDSRSFMDHSYEIAQAVRSAMLNMNSLNDVVSDL